MGLIRTVEPATEPISLAEAKAHMRVDLEDEDSLITSLITAVRISVENYTGRALVTQTWALTLDDEWPEDERIVLPRPPVASVTSIAYVDLNGDAQTLNSNQYTLFKRDTGEWAIRPAYDVIWPDVRRVPAAATVTFVAGVADSAVPEAIKQGILLIIAHLFENREAVNVGNAVSEFPMSATFLLDPFVVHPFR